MGIIGYNTIGTNLGNDGAIQACVFTAPNLTGTITKISVYTSTQGANLQLGAAIYADSSGTPNGTLLAHDSGSVTVSGSTEKWYDVPITYKFSANQLLWLAMWPGDNTSGTYRWDTGNTGQFAFAFTGTFETWPNPGNSGGALARVMSIYATYSPATGVVLPVRTVLQAKNRGNF